MKRIGCNSASGYEKRGLAGVNLYSRMMESLEVRPVLVDRTVQNHIRGAVTGGGCKQHVLVRFDAARCFTRAGHDRVSSRHKETVQFLVSHDVRSGNAPEKISVGQRHSPPPERRQAPHAIAGRRELSRKIVEYDLRSALNAALICKVIQVFQRDNREALIGARIEFLEVIF